MEEAGARGRYPMKSARPLQPTTYKLWGGFRVEKGVTLPIVNQYGYYEIRLESIGGLGANLCGKMLGELGIKYLGLNSASFSSYGSEKTGTPVKGFIRYSDREKEIRVHSPVREPHLLAVFHEALLQDASVGQRDGLAERLPIALEGCSEVTDIVINMPAEAESDSPQKTEKIAGLQKASRHVGLPASHIYCIDAGRIAMETKSRINVVMLGAIAKVMGFVKPEYLEAICKATLGKKYPAALAGNLEGIRRGYHEVKMADGQGEGSIGRNSGQEVQRTPKKGTQPLETVAQKKAHYDTESGIAPLWGYDTAPVGGINPHYGNSVANDVSPSRQGYYPIFIPERCINCGLCDTTCPDMVFQFQKGEYNGREMMINKGLDYYHCKGCLRCVEVCPVQALVRGVEAEQADKHYFLPNQELLRTPVYYEKTGPDGYITSESFLTEQHMDGGEL